MNVTILIVNTLSEAIMSIRTNCTDECDYTKACDSILDEVGLSRADEGGEGAVVLVVVGMRGESVHRQYEDHCCGE